MSNTQRDLFGGARAETPASTPETNGKSLTLIDGHALAFRSYYAIRQMQNSRGRSVNAVYGFVRSLLRLLAEDKEGDVTIVAFDAPAKTFRHEQFEGYKAGRADTPQDLPEQIDTIRRMVELMGVYQIEVPGLEADDIIGTLATRSAADGYNVEIVTSDRDAYQLVSERIVVRGLDRTERFGPAEVLEKYGVSVEQWVDFRSLTGDSSDNIPGAKGVGPVGASKLLQRYGTLDYVLENLDEVEPKGVANKIRASLEDVKFSRELSCIVIDAALDYEPDTWAQVIPSRDELRNLLLELEFHSILGELGLNEQVSYADADWPLNGDAPAVGFALDDASALLAECTGLALAANGKVAVAPDMASGLRQLEALGEVNAMDAKALVVWASKQGVRLEPGDDPLLMAYVLDPAVAQPVRAVQHFAAGTWADDARTRAVATAELFSKIPERLSGPVSSVYETIEKPLQRVLADMEITGVLVDEKLLVAQADALGSRLDEIQTQLSGIAGDPDLNISSTAQVAALLYDKLGLQPGRKTSGGKRSTAVSVLEGLRDQHEAVQLILDYRELSKLKGTYLDPLPKLINERTGRIHTTFNQTVAATGRLSSTNPNLQNIPVRTELGRQIRKAFIAAPGHKLLTADYSQIELRVLAHIADEPALIEAFREGQDIHRVTAAQVHGVEPEAVDSDMRRVAKIINFGVLYGMSAHRLTRELGIDYRSAEAFIRTYFERYPNVRKYIDGTIEFCRANGYVETLAGRRRVIADIRSPDRQTREYAERTSYNMPIQGTAADIIKLAMLQLAPALDPLGSRLVLQVHDELILEVPEDRTAETTEVVRDVMEGAMELKVPLVAGVSLGDNWLDAK